MIKEITLDKEVCIEDFRKAVSFISEDILAVSVKGHNLVIEIEDNKGDIDTLIQKIINMSKKFKMISIEIPWYSNEIQNVEYHTLEEFSDITFGFADGVYGFSGAAERLFAFFENKFEEIALAVGAEKRKYPVLLPVDKYQKTGYLKKSPQYAIFCCNIYENMDELENLSQSVDRKKIRGHLKEPQYALSPSACFHSYIEFEGKTLEHNKTISFEQSVFRNEGRFNYGEIGRLQDYHVREIVFFGDEEYVSSQRNRVMTLTKELLESFGLCGTIEKAYDPFVIPKFQKLKKIQMADVSKYEVRLRVAEDKDISAASFNLHGAAFTYPFDIQIDGCENPVTGCVGFGIERWVMAYLAQFGEQATEGREKT